MIDYIRDNFNWLFDGLGIAIIGAIYTGFLWLIRIGLLPKKLIWLYIVGLVVILLVILQFDLYAKFWFTEIPFSRFTMVLILIVTLIVSTSSIILLLNIKIKNLTAELITAKKNSNFLDDITGIENYKAIEHTLIERIASAKLSDDSITLLLVDVDGFGKLNSEYTMSACDNILKGVAQTLKSEIRNTDDRILRYKVGDEFLIIAYKTNGNNAVGPFSERLKKAIRDKEFKISGSNNTIRLTISIGVTEYNYNKENKEVTIERLEQALNEAKVYKNHAVLK
ncbi:hypothetical protein GCM10028805_65160 [Spirosoma harenae]